MNMLLIPKEGQTVMFYESLSKYCIVLRTNATLHIAKMSIVNISKETAQHYMFHHRNNNLTEPWRRFYTLLEIRAIAWMLT